ncbi:MAG: cation transporter [Burkholderiaceae bacterium]|nr:cation transporter [Burkholderiaceae bacterium]
MHQTESFFNLSGERGVLRISIGVSLLAASIGLIFGLASGSFSIVFDGVYSLIDAGMSVLSLVVVRLIASFATSMDISQRLKERFSMGFWHFEPMVLALNGILLTGVAAYALINAVSSLLSGGRNLDFGWAVAYAGVTVMMCSAIAWVEARANRKIQSDFLRMDVKGWIMAASITGALLIAFCIGYGVQGTRLQWISPYIDPAVLALVCLAIIPLPISSVRQALGEVFLITPLNLKRHVDAVVEDFVERHGFGASRSYVAKVGRSRAIEIYVIVPPAHGLRDISEWDALRDEIAAAIGSAGPDRWLTVVFTADAEWTG